MIKIQSPYSAAITGCGFQFYEFKRIFHLLMEENSQELLQQEIEENRLLQVNTRKARRTFMLEFKRRFASVPYNFWESWKNMSEEGQKAGFFYAILKTYKLIFDFHFNVTVKKWKSADQQVTPSDIEMEFNEIAAHDEFVDSWSESTKKKCISQYLSIIKQVGIAIDRDGNLRALHLQPNDCVWYFQTGESWFLEACLLRPYEIKELKEQVL
jgi:hypothetical protein